ncbi:SDR family NAD(P)-dependent oxidoreductase [Roseomonas sp. CECT 9278]|uniref:SDR family NAD(P)-dependent oxidoreductase n=1 Tax=Roseomonas sp. CECT 9278 TaxID=2845823 RepID=UPI001E42543D|nr:SDR family oxidoreductase [Roseomonas sp. CECT 9278]CAH0299616.1 3-phenylpropionate-dihydrodiol/cinnamic acid-dihydrodiol dehydrogenase [Roseomonas sp. CECT 9278]
MIANTSVPRRIVCVTGAARGLGAAIVRDFARQGAQVHACDVLEQEGGDLAGALRAKGLDVSFRRLDVTQECDWKALSERLATESGRLDVLVNNAGIIIRKPLAGTTREDWDRALAVNVTGAFLGMKHCRAMLARAAPSAIVNVSSTAGLIAHGDPSYTASKWALRGLTKSAALEFAPQGIRVNSVHPATIATPLTQAAPAGHIAANRHAIPLGREASAEEIAAVVVFLASEAASFMTGSEVAADGGLTTGGVAHMRSQFQAGLAEVAHHGASVARDGREADGTRDPRSIRDSPRGEHGAGQGLHDGAGDARRARDDPGTR